MTKKYLLFGLGLLVAGLFLWFALDNVDALLAAEGRARMLAIAMPEELTPVKSLDDVPAFESAARLVVASDNEALGGAWGARAR